MALLLRLVTQGERPRFRFKVSLWAATVWPLPERNRYLNSRFQPFNLFDIIKSYLAYQATLVKPGVRKSKKGDLPMGISLLASLILTISSAMASDSMDGGSFSSGPDST